MEQLSVLQTDQRSVWAMLLEKELLRLLEPFGFQRGGTATVWFFSSAVCGTWRTLPPLQWILNIPEAARGSSAMLYPLAGEKHRQYRSHTACIPALWGDLEQLKFPLPHILIWRRWEVVPSSWTCVSGSSEAALVKHLNSVWLLAVVIIF